MNQVGEQSSITLIGSIYKLANIIDDTKWIQSSSVYCMYILCTVLHTFTTAQPYNCTTLQLHNFTTSKPYDSTTLYLLNFQTAQL
jgi:hypothetical protein